MCKNENNPGGGKICSLLNRFRLVLANDSYSHFFSAPLLFLYKIGLRHQIVKFLTGKNDLIRPPSLPSMPASR